MIIRQETPADYNEVFTLIERAFEKEEYSDHREHFLVENLRKSESFIPELSIVAEVEGKIVGYILLTKIVIADYGVNYPSLAMAPVAVLPELQGQGIGGALIEYAHQAARKLDFTSIILLGHPTYYPKFGYTKASNYAIKLPFEVLDENCMAIELQNNALQNVAGVVVYPKEFYDY